MSRCILAAVRPFPLDDALLLFDRERGVNLLLDGPELVGLRQEAPRSVQFGITNLCNLACRFDTGDNRPRLVAALAGLTDESESMARERLLAPVPVVATRGAFERTARACLAALEAAGARVDLRRNDG